MSVTKLESLPNEILIDIFEKYLNGIDIIKAFGFQLNRRFDALIAQCRRLRFNFIRCHKDDFRFCMGLLRYYTDKIEELALSEQNTPGQIHAFLSFYPTFSVFKQLRRLYFHIDLGAVEQRRISIALNLLFETRLETLSIKITKASRLNTFSSIHTAVLQIFQMKTVKKLIIACDLDNIRWSELSMGSSRIEYLTMRNKFFKYEDLIYIFRCAPGLKYLDIDLSFHSSDYQSELLSKNSLPKMSVLRTAIFNIHVGVHQMLRGLEHYLRGFSSLHRLEIKTQERCSDLSGWETFLQTSLPSLVYFTFEIMLSDSIGDERLGLLESVQTPFWIEKQNFNIVVKFVTPLNSERFTIATLNTLNRYILYDSVARWYIAPQRQLTGNLSVLDEISILCLNRKTLPSLESHYLNNVTRLVLTALNDEIFESMIKHVNCHRIKHLDVSALKRVPENFASVLPYIRNVTSLRITLDQLCDGKFACFERNKDIMCLDLSADGHNFHENDLSVIENMFPNLQHLTINSRHLENVRQLQTYLPRLRSLTFWTFKISASSSVDDDEEELFDYNLRRQSKFLFQRQNNYITVWVDEAAFQDRYWPAPATTHSYNSDPQNSTEKSLSKKKRKIFSFSSKK